ncbi:MAG: vitamin-B12 independent methionine synthase [Anaeromyxobacteraceae bacterium]|nr:vitamin-B12 independent methionine synthase [Anaeromyxobacteraceae bacterium]
MTSELGHPYRPDAAFDGGDLDCGSGLLLLIRQHIDPLPEGKLLEIRSREPSVREDLPAWCRMTGNALVSEVPFPGGTSFLVSKGAFVAPAQAPSPAPASRPSVAAAPAGPRLQPVSIPASLPTPAPAPAIPPLAVMGVGSWPRPRWLLEALHAHLEGRLSDEAFEETADDAVRLALQGQLDGGADVVGDGEQRRDNYASFVGARLDNCQLVPITDLLAYVSDPAEFERELRALDVPAGKVRHPAVFGPLSRRRPLAVHELEHLRQLTDRPAKVALPGPYLLTRTMWMECVSDRAYPDRESLARDVARVLREELHFLLAGGAALVQLDEPILSEVVFGGSVAGNRTFMCGVLDARGDPAAELAFAEGLLQEVTRGLPRERLALHVCRGNWTPDERVALSGDYRPLLPLLSRAPVGTLLLELATPRAGELEVLRALPDDKRIGVGVVNQKRPAPEPAEAVLARAERAVQAFGPDRVLLNPDCGFATFADNPIAGARLATAHLATISAAARALRARHRLD